MNNKEKAKEEVRKDNGIVHMDSEYCQKFIKENSNCDKCEYSFVCNDILLKTLRNSINEVREDIIENGNRLEDINSEECKKYRIINNSCENCYNDYKCYIKVLEIFKKEKGLNYES